MSICVYVCCYNLEELEISAPSIAILLKEKVISQVIYANDNPNKTLSKDSLPVILRSHLDKILVFNNEVNLGMMFNRLKYLSYVNTDYLIYSDSDDILIVSGIMKYLKFANSDIGLATGANVLADDTTSTNINNFNENNELYKYIPDIPIWREDFMVNGLINTNYFKQAMKEFIDHITNKLIIGYGTDIINGQEDLFITTFYKAWMYNHQIFYARSTVPVVYFNNYKNNRMSKAYNPTGKKWDENEELVKYRTELINNLIKEYYNYE